MKPRTAPAAFNEFRFMDSLNEHMENCLSLIRTVKDAIERDGELSYLAVTLGLARDEIETCHALSSEWWDKAGSPRIQAERKRKEEGAANSPFSPLDEPACARMEALVVRSRKENAARKKKANR